MLLLLLISVLSLNAHSYNQKLFEMSPPKAKPYQKRQVKRMAMFRDFKFAGFLGETDQGLLAIRDISKTTPENQKFIKKLVDEENKDRLQIYKEIANYNKLKPKQKQMLIQNFFEVYRNTDAKGTYYFEKKAWQKHY